MKIKLIFLALVCLFCSCQSDFTDELIVSNSVMKDEALCELLESSSKLFSKNPIHTYFQEDFFENLEKMNQDEINLHINEALEKMFKKSKTFKIAFNNEYIQSLSVKELIEQGEINLDCLQPNHLKWCIICNEDACDNSFKGLRYTNNPLFGIGILIHCDH